MFPKLLDKNHAWPTEFCKGRFSRTDMNNFPFSDNRRKENREQEKGQIESTRPTCNCQLFPEEVSFHSISGQWEPLIISVRSVVRNSGSAGITKSQSIKITTPQRGEHVKSNYQFKDSDSYPRRQLFNWRRKNVTPEVS